MWKSSSKPARQLVSSISRNQASPLLFQTVNSCSACSSHHCLWLQKKKKKNPPLKKFWKLRMAKQPVATKEALCCYRPQLIFLGACPKGLNSLYSKKWFQLTRCECPKWVTAVNSISAICCPLGHFWTAA